MVRFTMNAELPRRITILSPRQPDIGYRQAICPVFPEIPNLFSSVTALDPADKLSDMNTARKSLPDFAAARLGFLGVLGPIA